MHATIDWETYGEAGLEWDGTRWRALPGAGNKRSISAVGAAAYAEHPSTDILTLSYRLPFWPAGQVKRWRPGLPLPVDLFAWIAQGGLVEAHNVMFERLIWLHVATRRYGFPPLPAEQLRCSMARARVNSLPGALEDLTAVLGTAKQKDADGKRLLNKFAQPRNPTKADPRLRITPADDPADGERLYSYCDDDVLAEEEASALVPPMSAAELEFWQVDQEMNWRGIGVDRAGVRDMIAVLEQAQVKYGEECLRITGGIGPGQVQALRGWLAAQGVYVDSLDAEAIDEALSREGLPEKAKRVLQIRALVGSASVKKLYAMDRSTSADNRVRNIIIHHGARTGRPTGDLVQPLNLPKAGPDLIWCDDCCSPTKPGPICSWCGKIQPPTAKVFKWPEVPKHLAGQMPIDWVMPVMANRSLDEVEHRFGDALLTISGCVRGQLQAGPGNDLIASDYSAIEAVVTAALAGCDWRMETFRSGKDIYLMSASNRNGGLTYEQYLSYKEENGGHHWHRQKWGKVFELACLGPQTQVLTKRGYLDIVDVTINDKLWDGEEWVQHAGLVNRGKRSTILLDGVTITPDHLVSLGDSWKAAGKLGTSGRWLTQALESGSESLRRLAEWNDAATGNTLPKCSALARRLRTGSLFTIFEMENPPAATVALNWQRRLIARSSFATRTLCQMTSTAVDFLTGCLQLSPAVTIPTPASTTPTAAGVLKCAANGATTNRLFFGTSKLFLVGMSLLSRWTERTTTVVMNPATFGLSPRAPTTAIGARCATCKRSSHTTNSVYDLAHAGPRNRFTIKTDSGHLVVHNCGFGGWVGAVRAFDAETPDDEVKDGIVAWRKASPEIVEMWGGQERGSWRDKRLERFGFEGAFVNAVQYPNELFTSNGIQFFMRGDALIVRLLSGRELTYHNPRLFPSTREWALEGVLEITYDTWNSNPKYGARGWGPMKTYAGKIAENIVQATAHDIQRYGILALRRAGYGVVLHVYDENVAEVPLGFGSVEEFEAIMSTMPPWAANWPIKAGGGWRGKRYRKA